MIFEASAPSNIALIKYMGKVDSQANLPTNSSLSLTLENLRTFVRLTPLKGGQADTWQPLTGKGLTDISLNEKSQTRYLQHFKNLKQEWGVTDSFLIESANNFPADCGLASSASSFAALTKVATEALQKMTQRQALTRQQQAELSRRGSGSSCRSFFGPFAIWQNEQVRAVEFPFPGLIHQVVVVEAGRKLVSSSEAHRRVTQSALFEGRAERAEKRLAELVLALQSQNWKLAFAICWSEFWDMHALFETCVPAFGYMEPGTMDVLKYIRGLWTAQGDGPLVTMDAGANVHFIWRREQQEMAMKISADLQKKYIVFSNAN